MKKNTTWEILNNFKFQISKVPSSEHIQKLVDILLQNRGLMTEKEKEAFLHPDLSTVTPEHVGINRKEIQKTIERIKKAKEENQHIIVYGDYDVDGITGTAILWETLHGLGMHVQPFIPSRVDEGYGLSEKGIEHILTDFPETKIIITVDNGIVANEAVDFANKKGIDVIITDHHVASDTKPEAYAIVHTTQLCGAGVGWMLSKEFYSVILGSSQKENDARISGKKQKSRDPGQGRMTFPQDHLALVALATVADLVPLTNANRIVLIEGLNVLHTTKRPGIVALCEEAGIDQSKIGVYEIGHVLAPRLNAMGRISIAMDSLRLLCTKDRLRAKVLAEKHGLTNKERQELTRSLSDHAIESTMQRKDNILFVADVSYDEGVIGLVAGKLVETYYRPSIVIAKKERVSKASARSIAGFNIIEFIRSGQHLLLNAGGHPMAAGFTIATEKIKEFEKFVTENAEKFDTSLLSKKLSIDCEIPLAFVSQKLFDALQILQPFGMKNPEPTFVSAATIVSVKQIGKEKNHLSFTFQSVIPAEAGIQSFRHSGKPKAQPESNSLNRHPELDSGSPGSPIRSGMTADVAKLNAIAFGIGERFSEFSEGQEVTIAYTISENVWNDKKSLQLKIKDIKTT